jgi:hypothetical protein
MKIAVALSLTWLKSAKGDGVTKFSALLATAIINFKRCRRGLKIVYRPCRQRL